MKKYLFLSTIIAIIGLYSCTKNTDSTTDDTSPENINADVLSAGIKVAYGTNIANSVFPATPEATSAPVLDTPFAKVYRVFKGGYLTIIPHNLSGNVSGYYVQIVGAASYFKVDYTKASGFRKNAGNDPDVARGYGTGFIDSTIVLKMPASIGAGTFYLKYAAYDSLNHVSNTTTAQIIVTQEGDNTVNDSLIGTWRHMYTSCYSNGKYQCIWSLDTGYAVRTYYDCVNGLLVRNNSLTAAPIPYEIAHFDERMTFDKYGFTANYNGSFKVLNVENSSCTNYVYDYQSNDTSVNTGTISFDAANKKLTLIFQPDGTIGLTYRTFTLLELTDSSFTLLSSGSTARKYIRL